MEQEVQNFINICDIKDQEDVIVRPFDKAIKQILIEAGGLKRDVIKKIIVYLLYKKLIFNMNVSPYYEIATRIDYAADNTKNFRHFLDVTEWHELVIATKKEINKQNITDIRICAPRINVVANSIKSFIAKGLKVKVTLEGISFDPDDKIIKEEVRRIESDIQNLGARKLLEIIFRSQKENIVLSRYIVNRNLYQGKKRASIPFGFLINLCLKNIAYTGIKMSESSFNMLVNSCFKKARDLLAIYDIESYTFFEDLFISREKLFDTLFSYAVFDSNFCFLQESPRLAIKISLGVFKNVPKDIFVQTFHLDVWEIEKILQYVFSQSSRSYLDFSAREVASAVNLPYGKTKHLLNLFSHNVSEINKGFNTPTSFSSVDFLFKPFIQIDENNFLLVNKFLCATNIYEAFLFNLRKNGNIKIDAETGGYIEKFIYEQLKKKKISFHKGDFIGGEADLLIRNKNSIFVSNLKRRLLLELLKVAILSIF